MISAVAVVITLAASCNETITPEDALRSGPFEDVVVLLDGGCAIAAGLLACWSGNRAEITRAHVVSAWTDMATVTEGCTLGRNGSAYCWPGARPTRLPQAADAELRFQSLAASGNRVFGVDLQGRLHTWQKEPASPPIATMTNATFQQVSVGRDHACAVDALQQIFCWGDNRYGQLGNVQQPPTGTPLPVAAGSFVSAGATHTCALAAGQVTCWGDGVEPRPGQVEGLSFVSLDVGDHRSCAIDAAGSVYCWTNESPVERVQLERRIRKIDVGVVNTCGITTARELWCWNNRQAQPWQVWLDDRLS